MDNREIEERLDEKRLEELLPQELRWLEDTLTPLDGGITLPKSLTGAALLTRFATEMAAVEESEGPRDTQAEEGPPPDQEKVIAFPARRWVRYAASAAAALLLVIGVSRILPGLGTKPLSTSSSESAGAPGNYVESYTQLRQAIGGTDEAAPEETQRKQDGLQATPTPQNGPLMAVENGVAPNPDTDTPSAGEGSNTDEGAATPRAAAFTAGGPRVTSVSTGTGGEQSTQSADGFIYTLRETGQGQEVLIVDASELAVVSHLAIDEKSDVQGLLLAENQLVLIDRAQTPLVNTETLGEVTEDIYPNYNKTAIPATPVEPATQMSCAVTIYDISDRQNPSLTKRYEQDGDYLTAHLENDTLYLVSYKSVTGDVRADSTSMAQLVPSVQATPLVPKDILLGENQAYENYVLVTAFPMKSTAQSTSIALLGDTRTVQLEGNALYLAADNGESSQLTTLTLQKSGVTLGGTATLDGILLEGSLSQATGVVRLVTQSWQGSPHAKFYILGENLKILGRIDDVAPGETVQGIAYLTVDVAYLSTYAEKESVVVLDLKNPEAPKILGKLENPLSASVLTPLGENRYLAVGDGPQESQRVLVLDCTNPLAPKVYGEVLFTGENGRPYSKARFLSGAVAVDEGEKRFALPIYGADLGDGTPFGGYLIYDYSSENLTQLAAIEDSLSSASGHFQDGNFYTLTEGGIALWDGEGSRGKTLRF